MSFPSPDMATDDVVIRRPRMKDMTAIGRLSGCGIWKRAATNLETEREFIERAFYAAQSANGDGRFWVADVDGTVVATIGSDIAEDRIATVAWLRVDPIWREPWLLLLLLYTALQDCHKNGAVKVRLEAQILLLANATMLFDSGHLVDKHYCRDDEHRLDVYPSLYAAWEPVDRWDALTELLTGSLCDDQADA
jgi:GNAT superfamily N-acetyltransferase